MARVVELILSDELVGSGQDGDPFRRVRELWTKDGELVARDDAVGRELGLDTVKVASSMSLWVIK